MIENYIEESIDVADNFIKTVCFIDDQPFFNDSEDPVNDEIDHRLNADIITKNFARKGKSCTFLKYNKIEDEDIALTLVKNSDVAVLDWRIVMEPDVQSVKQENSENSSEEDLEEDIEVSESRGRYAIRLIERVLTENKATPKLLIIFTAEYEIEKIYLPIKEKLDELEINYEENVDELTFHNDKIRISIYFKLPKDNKYISEEVKRKKVDFTKFPDIINSEFAILTDSLVLQATIRSITEVRNNTFNLLESYNKKLDPAYLTHRSLLPNPGDAEEQLLEIIGSDIKSLIKESDVSKIIQTRALPLFLEDRYNSDEYPLYIENRDKFEKLKVPETLDKLTLHSIVLEGLEKKIHTKKTYNENILFSKECHKNLTQTFVDDPTEAKISNFTFSILTTIKPRYQLSSFILTLGTILKEINEEVENYWICVQPKCDSGRIKKNKRAFLFLKLTPVNERENFHFIIKEDGSYKFFKIIYKIHESKLIEFDKDLQGNISSTNSDGKIKFCLSNGSYMIWVAELKNDFAQSVSNILANELSRVGLDLSEWLRRSSAS